MNKIKNITHLADIHIPKSPTRHDEIRNVFNNTYKSLKNNVPDRIVIVGDLFHDYIDLEPEATILAAEFLNELAKIAPVRITRGNHDCFTGDHEVLTKNGWVKLDSYVNSKNNDEVLTFNSVNKHFEFERPTDRIKNSFDGELIKINTNKCSFIVTPKHEILLKNGSKNNLIKKNAEDVLNTSELRIPLSSTEIITETDKWFELLGFCLADASFIIKNKETKNGRIQFHLKKQTKIDYLVELLTMSQIPFKLRDEDKKRGTKVISIYSQYAMDIMKFFNYSKELSFKSNILNYEKYKIKSFIDGYLNGDDCNVNYERFSCVNIFKSNAEILTTLSNYIGYYAHVVENSKDQHLFFISKSNKFNSTKIISTEKVKYDGDVYCLTVPNENLYVRYKNKTFITGNCRKKNLKRIDAIEAVVKNINNPNIIYYNETGLFDDNNITWCVWKHGEKNNNPWNKKAIKRKDVETDRIFIDLFHDPINGAKSPVGFEFNRKTFNSIEHFKGDLLLAGDIHKKQFFFNEK